MKSNRVHVSSGLWHDSSLIKNIIFRLEAQSGFTKDNKNINRVTWKDQGTKEKLPRV